MDATKFHEIFELNVRRKKKPYVSTWTVNKDIDRKWSRMEADRQTECGKKINAVRLVYNNNNVSI